MTMTTHISTIVTSIAGLSITVDGRALVIKGMDAIPENAVMLSPILYPRPDGFITNFDAGWHNNERTLGTHGTQQMTCKYTLNYVFSYSQTAGAFWAGSYAKLTAALDAVFSAIMTNDDLLGTGGNVYLGGVEMFGPITDPTGNSFIGAVFAIEVEEYIGG